MLSRVNVTLRLTDTIVINVYFKPSLGVAEIEINTVCIKLGINFGNELLLSTTAFPKRIRH